MTDKKKRKLTDLGWFCWFERILPVAALVILWVAASNSGSMNEVLFPSIQTFFSTFLMKIQNGSLQEAILVSMGRVLKGFFLSSVLGIVLGILIGLSRHMQNFSDLFIMVLKPIPPIAWIPLVILWMGIGESSKVFLIFLGGFFNILINVMDGIRYTDKKLTEVAYAMAVPKRKYVLQVVIPAALPNIFTGLRLALGSCWTCVVAAELVASTSGVGYMISNARNFGQMDVVVVGMLTIGIIGKIMDMILVAISDRVLSWNI